QSPYSGAFANPSTGPYLVQIVGQTSTGSVYSNVVSVTTLLVLECDLEDDKPSSEEISSGLYRPALDPGSSECMKLGLVPAGSGLPSAQFATSPPQFSSIVEADLDNDPSDGLEVQSAHVRQEMQSTFSSGSYYVVIQGLRDLAGNYGVQGYGPDG